MAGNPDSDKNKEKRAAALRDNLKRRKAFVKGVKQKHKDDPEKTDTSTVK